jgi:hypothetical protein
MPSNATEPYRRLTPTLCILFVFVVSSVASTMLVEAMLAQGEPVIKCPYLLNVLKYTYDHSCY